MRKPRQPPAFYTSALNTNHFNTMNTNSNNNQDKTPAKKELESIKSDMKPKRFLEVLSPSDCINFEPPADYILAGDCHLTRGNITVLGGAPGVGKSRAALGLAVAGAKGVDWMGYKVTQQFKTLIIQCENGMFRLKGEFESTTLVLSMRMCALK